MDGLIDQRYGLESLVCTVMWGFATLEKVRSTEHDREQHPTWDLAV